MSRAAAPALPLPLLPLLLLLLLSCRLPSPVAAAPTSPETPHVERQDADGDDDGGALNCDENNYFVENDIQVSVEDIGKTTQYSDDEPITRALEPITSRIPPLLAHINFIDRAITTSAEAAKVQNLTQPTTTTCNYPVGDEWINAVSDYFHFRQWGTIDDDCVTDVYGAGVDDAVAIVDSDDPGSDTNQVYAAVVEHARGVNQYAQTAARLAGVRWQRPTRATDFVYSVRTQTCNHDYAAFVRRDGVWYVAERITNDDKDLTLGEGERRFLREHVTVRDGKLVAPKLSAPLINETSGCVDELQRGTTTLSETTGAVTGSEFVDVYGPNNLAVQEALRAGDHNTQQASDATTTSNVAILALPLTMNIVPVALIADVNTVGMLVYTLLTDVLTTVPLAIKGIEVLTIGVASQKAVVTRVTGANVRDGRNKAGEVWVAECRANGDLTSTGVVLLVVALGAMVGGVIAEIVAKRWVKRRRAAAGAAVMGVAHEDAHPAMTIGANKPAAGLIMAGFGGTAREEDVRKQV